MRARRGRPEPSALVFGAWAVIGLGFGVAAVTAPTIGIFVFLATALLLIAVLRWPAGRNASAAGLLSGPGPLLLYVGYLNRSGPGRVCEASAAGESCVEQWSPWPEVAAGVFLLVAGLGLFAVLRRRRAPLSHVDRATSHAHLEAWGRPPPDRRSGR